MYFVAERRDHYLLGIIAVDSSRSNVTYETSRSYRRPTAKRRRHTRIVVERVYRNYRLIMYSFVVKIVPLLRLVFRWPSRNGALRFIIVGTIIYRKIICFV